jgi:hypothetical protein
VPTGSSPVTVTSPSSVAGISSKPMVGRMMNASATRPTPTPMTVGRWCSARAMIRL